MVTTRSAVISTSKISSLLLVWLTAQAYTERQDDATQRELGRQLRLEIVGARLGDLDLRPVADGQLPGAANAHRTVDFRGVAGGTRNGDGAVHAIDQYPHGA